MFKIIGFVSCCLMLMFLLSTDCFSQIFFEENFESGDIPKAKWQPTGSWKLVKADGPPALGKFVLYMDGGEAGISVKNDFADFDYEADFRSGTGYTGFVFRAQDTANNFYMHQVSVTGSGHTPNNMRWHWKVAGTWNVEPIPFMNGVTLDSKVWYRVKFEVKGDTFKTWVVELEKLGKEQMVQIGEWTDKSKSYNKGAIGFRASGGEVMEYDNIKVTSIGFKLAVDLGDKLTTTWSKVKLNAVVQPLSPR